MEETKQPIKETPSTPVEKPVVPEVKSEIKPEVIKTADDLNLSEDRAKADMSLDGPYQQSPLFHMIANYFNIEQRDFSTVAPKIGVIVDWVQEKYGVKTQEDILLKIREAEDLIQRPGWDEKRYANLYKYVYLDNQVLALQKAKKAFERNSNG